MTSTKPLALLPQLNCSHSTVFNMLLAALMRSIVRTLMSLNQLHDRNFFLKTDAVTGGSRDHAYGFHKIPIGYTYEMRGNGKFSSLST